MEEICSETHWPSACNFVRQYLEVKDFDGPGIGRSAQLVADRGSCCSSKPCTASAYCPTMLQILHVADFRSTPWAEHTSFQYRNLMMVDTKKCGVLCKMHRSTGQSCHA